MKEREGKIDHNVTEVKKKRRREKETFRPRTPIIMTNYQKRENVARCVINALSLSPRLNLDLR